VGGVDAERYAAAVKLAVETTLDDRGVLAGEVSVSLLRDTAIQVLNARYLEHDWPTDVLSFALHTADEPLLGDVYIGLDRARHEARQRDLPDHEEVVRLAVHGTLHVLGNEHPEPAEEREQSEFFTTQERLVAAVMAALPGGER